jgi:hypothetical protein
VRQQTKKALPSSKTTGLILISDISAFAILMREDLHKLVNFGHFVHNICSALSGLPRIAAALFLESDGVRTGPEFTQLIEPNRIAFVLSFMWSEIVFSLRGSDRHMTQSADRIV